MKPFNYYGHDPSQFAPCRADWTQEEVSVKRHPAIASIRNKRRRMRKVRELARLGIRDFLRPVWVIYPER